MTALKSDNGVCPDDYQSSVASGIVLKQGKICKSVQAFALQKIMPFISIMEFKSEIRVNAYQTEVLFLKKQHK